MPPKRGKVQKEEVQVSLGPQVREGEVVFGVAHIFASFNDTFVHVTDLSGRLETYILFFILFFFHYIYLFQRNHSKSYWWYESKS